MPNLPYNYNTLNGIGWPLPFAPVGPGATSCVLAPLNGLPGIATPIAPTIPQLLNAILSIGAYPGPAPLNLIEDQWRVASFRAAATVAGGNLVSTGLIGAVDPSEQATLSYQMGSVMTALTGITLAPTLFFQHLERFNAGNPGQVVYMTPQRPDFISFIWIGMNIVPLIWEAKGRVGGAVNGVLRVGFTQARSVTGVGANPTGSWICCLCRGAAGGLAWTLEVVDPEQPSEGISDPALIGQIVASYYEPYFGMLNLGTGQQTISYAQESFTIVQIPGTDSQMGIDQRLLALLQSYYGQQIGVSKLGAQVLGILKSGYTNGRDPAQFVNPSGIYSAAGDSWLKQDS